MTLNVAVDMVASQSFESLPNMYPTLTIESLNVPTDAIEGK